MGMSENRGHHVKRVVLPSGKTIEVVYFDSPSVPDQTPAGAAEHRSLPPDPHADAAIPADEPASIEPVRELQLCPDCTSDLVYPTEWEEAGPHNWRVSLRCPECEWHDTAVHMQEAVDEFDLVLDHGTEALTRDLKRLARANMAEDLERFTRALQADAILPEDF